MQKFLESTQSQPMGRSLGGSYGQRGAGSTKQFFRVFHKIVWKKPNELLSQPDTSGWDVISGSRGVTIYALYSSCL